MKALAWGIGCLVALVVLLFGLLLAKIGIADIVYAMLSGAIVGFSMGMLGYAKGLASDRVVILLSGSIFSAAVSWFIALLLVKLLKVNLLGITALAFDLLIGIVGAVTFASYLMQCFMAKRAEEK